MQTLGEIGFTFPTDKVEETYFLKSKLTGTFAKHFFTELFLIQTSLKTTQTSHVHVPYLHIHKPWH